MVGKVEDFIETRALGEMTDFDRTLVPSTFRLDVPLAHSRELRKIAEHLRTLANKLEALSVRTDLPERTLLFQGWFEGRHCRYQLNSLAKPKISRRNKVATY